MSEIITDGGMSGRDVSALSTAKNRDGGLYKSIYDEGAKAKAAQAKKNAARQSRFNALQSGRAQGKVSGKVDVKHLSQEQQKQVGVIRAVARETGINMVLFESKADANGTFIGENSHFDSATNTIWIDVNAGKNSVGDTNSYALLRVLSHELTHFIQAGSAENYAALKAFTVSELEKQGKNLDDLVQGKLDRAANMRAQLKENKASEAEIKAHELSRADAEDEVIADACEMMLRDSAAIGRLAETDAGLYGKVKAFVLGFIKRVKDAFDRIDANSQEAKALMQGGKYLDELQRLWDVGLEQAVRNGQRAQSSAANAEAVEAKVQFQARVGYTEEGLPVYSSNFLNGSTREERQTRILHLVTDVWSKKPIRLSIEENGKQRTILANFDPYVDPEGRINSDATKLAYGNRKGTMSDQKTTEKLADDFPEIISTAQFAKSKIEEGKTTDAHKDVLVWHYFVNKIGFINDNGRYAEYGVNIDVKERKDGEYFYSFAAQKIKGSELSQAPTLYGDPKAIHASVRKNEIVPAIANIIIPDSGENSNKSSEKNIQAEAIESSDIHTAFSLRDKEPPKKTVIGYKAFYARDGKLYPPMVSNITEEEGKAKVSKATSGTMKSIETPVGVWLDADVGGIMVDENGEPVRTTDTKRLRVKNDKSGGGATLAFRPGWHLGEWPDAKQFNKNDANGNRTLMPDDLVFAKCEVSADVDYQLDALAYGINAKGKLIRSQAGLPRVPVDGMYKYRTNVDPTTAPWIIAGSMRVLEVLSDEDCARICAEHNVEPSQRYSGHPINLADFGLKQGAVSPTGDLARFAKNDASRANDALLERALSDKQYADAYVARDINFDDPALANEFAMNGQNIEEYRKQYEEKVQRSDRDYAEAVEAKVQYSDRPSDQMEEDKYFERMMDKWDGQATGGRVRIGSIKSGSIYTGVGLPARKLFMDYSKIAKALDNHSDHLDIGIIKQIPTLLSTPVVITEPINPQVKNTVNVFGELRGENGIPIMVALLMRADQGGAVMVNIVRTIEMRSDYARLITDASTLYLDKNKKRTHEWFQGLGNSSVPFAGTRSGVIRSIAYQAENSNNSSEKNIQRSDRDSEGRELSSQQQEFFKESKVRDEDGNLKVMYHGTPYGGFDRFRSGTYFSDMEWYADGYQSPSASSIRNRYDPATNRMTYKAYLNIKKPFDTRIAANRRIFQNDYYRKWGTGAPLSERGLPDWTDGLDLQEFIEENELDFDGLILDEGGFPNAEGGVTSRGVSYVIFDPAQAKRTDNTAPTSDERMQFSLRDNVEEVGDLVALHNLTAENLRGALELGGFPMPSIAIVKAKDGHTRYGDISVVFGRDTIDPQSSAKNKVYGADAWTPTKPRTDYQVNGEKAFAAIRRLRTLAAQVGDFYDSSISQMLSFAHDDETNLSMEQLVQKAVNGTGMMAAYLTDKGTPVERVIKYTESKPDGWSEDRADDYVAFKQIMGADFRNAKSIATEKLLADHEAEFKAAFPWIEPLYTNQGKVFQARARFSTLIGGAQAYETKAMTKSEPFMDTFTMNEAMYKAIDKADFTRWVRKELDGIIGKAGIRNGKDPFTASGDKRSFKQTHYDYTLENIVKAMQDSQDERGEGLWGATASGMQAVAVKEFKSVDEMHKVSDRLSRVTQEQMDAAAEKVNNQITAIMTEVKRTNKAHSDNAFIESDVIGDALINGAQSVTVAAVTRSLKKDGYTVSAELAQKILAMYDAAANLPTEYFEAKPQRAVGLDEIKAVILPDSTDDALIEQLGERGVNVVEYAEGNEQERLDALNGLGGVRFSERDGYTYKALASKPNMLLTPLTDSVGTLDRKAIVEAGYQNVKDIGRIGISDMPAVFVHDIGREVHVGKRSLVHGLDRRASQQSTLIQHIGEVLANSILINEAYAKKETAKSSYVLLGAGREENGDTTFAAFVVNRFTGELEDFDVLYSAKTKTEPAASKAEIGAKTALLPTGSTISIADLLEDVKEKFSDVLPQNVLDHFGIQRQATEISDYLKFSDRDISDLTSRDVLANLDVNSIENENVALAAKEFQHHAADLHKVTQRIAILRGQIADAKAKNSPTMELEGKLKKQLHLADLVQARMDKAYEAPSLKAEAEARLETIQKYVKGKTADEVARDIRGMQAELSTLRAKARKADKTFDIRTLASLAQSMRDDFGATMPTQTISDRLLAAFSAWQNAKTEDEENAAIGAVGRVLGDVLNSCTYADDSAVTGTADIRAALKGARISLTSRQMQEAASQSLGRRAGIRIGNMQKEDACAPSFLCLSHRRYIQAKDSSVSKDSWVRI